MIKLAYLASHVYELELPHGDVYFSYETPIAFYEDDEMTLFITDEYFSPVTSKHKKIIKTTHDGHYIIELSEEQFKSRLELFIS